VLIPAAEAVDQAAPALVKACPAVLVVELPMAPEEVAQAKVKECPVAPVEVNLVEGRAVAPAEVKLVAAPVVANSSQ
jgi:hypothetical protein